MRRYAQDTTVSVESSVNQITALLQRYKAKGWGYSSDTSEKGKIARVFFQFGETKIMFVMLVPAANDPQFTKDHKGRSVPPEKRPKLAAQEECRLWRSLLLVIKGKLQSTTDGIETIDEAFLAQTVLPNGETMATFHRDFLKPAITAGKFQAICNTQAAEESS